MNTTTMTLQTVGAGDLAGDPAKDLTMLIQPRYFCGQLLADQDLTTLLAWGQGKFRLECYRDGWGVVCGLDVRCHPDYADKVIVGPGYAIGYLGDDIIVPKDAPVSLTEICDTVPAPCEPQPNQKAGGVSTTSEARLDLLGGSYPESQLRVADLYLRYLEVEAEMRTPLGRNGCGQGQACEPSRTYEQFTIVPLQGDRLSNPMQTVADGWEASYRQSSAIVPSFLDWYGNHKAASAADVRNWLLAWVKKCPLHQFSLVQESLLADDAPDPKDKAWEGWIAPKIAWLALDFRNAFLAQTCRGWTGDDLGVPLGRVWLHVDKTDVKTPCRVLAIDTAAPYRRGLNRRCWPAPLGKVNAASVLWHRKEEALSLLGNLGFHTDKPVPYPLPQKLADLPKFYDILSASPCANYGDTLVVRWIDAGAYGQRIVGFDGQFFPMTDAAGTESTAARDVAQEVPLSDSAAQVAPAQTRQSSQRKS